MTTEKDLLESVNVHSHVLKHMITMESESQLVTIQQE